MPTRLSRMFVHSRLIGVLIIAVLVVSFLFSSLNSQQQLNQAKHLTAVTKCQSRVNNQFNAVLKYNTSLSLRTNTINDKDRANLASMVADVAKGIKENNGPEINQAIFHYNSERKKIDKERKALVGARAQYPKLPSEQCR